MEIILYIYAVGCIKSQRFESRGRIPLSLLTKDEFLKLDPSHKTPIFETWVLKNPSMVGGLSDEDRIWRIKESVKVFCELTLIEILKAFVIVLAVVGESVNGDLCCFTA